MNTTRAVAPLLIFVLPGGGYGTRVEHEAEPVAEWLRSEGHRAEALAYPVAPHRYPEAFTFVRDAIAAARESFDGRIGVLGFSAGGHLAGHVAYAAAAEPSCRPDFAVLCYPVVSLGPNGHLGSRDNLLGDDKEFADALSLQNLVTEASPPTFIWHTADDETVPLRHSLLIVEALELHSVPFEFHVFNHGQHGLGLAEHTRAEPWTALCASWLRSIAAAS